VTSVTMAEVVPSPCGRSADRRERDGFPGRGRGRPPCRADPRDSRRPSAEGVANTLAALTPRAARRDGAPIHVIPDTLSVHQGEALRRRATRSRVGLCFTPTHAAWANPGEARHGPRCRPALQPGGVNGAVALGGARRRPHTRSPRTAVRPTASRRPGDAASRRGRGGRTRLPRRSTGRPSARTAISGGLYPTSRQALSTDAGRGPQPPCRPRERGEPGAVTAPGVPARGVVRAARCPGPGPQPNG
jgi:hypothetical protein